MPATELLALGTGLAAGIIFAAANLPIPAPPNLAGILGVVGIYLGFKAVEHSDQIITLLS